MLCANNRANNGIRKWSTLEMLAQVHSFDCVSKNKSILSITTHAIYRTVRIQLYHISHGDNEYMHTLSYDHPQIGSMNHFPLSRVRTWNSGIPCMSLYGLNNCYWLRHIHCSHLQVAIAGGWFSIKMASYKYSKSHFRDEKILRPSYPHNGISYTGEMASLYIELRYRTFVPFTMYLGAPRWYQISAVPFVNVGLYKIERSTKYLEKC